MRVEGGCEGGGRLTAGPCAASACSPQPAGGASWTAGSAGRGAAGRYWEGTDQYTTRAAPSPSPHCTYTHKHTHTHTHTINHSAAAGCSSLGCCASIGQVVLTNQHRGPIRTTLRRHSVWGPLERDRSPSVNRRPGPAP